MINVYLSSYRGFCAGVVRSINAVKDAIKTYGPPIYVKHWIVHNMHVVKELESMGAVFIHNVEDIPSHSYVICSAHGTEKNIMRAISSIPGVHLIDAACPLVLKIHNEVKHYSQNDFFVFIIGEKKHQETKGIASHITHNNYAIVSHANDIYATLPRIGNKKTSYVTQTTLSLQSIQPIIKELKVLFPDIHYPKKSDICFATTNRQKSVEEIAPHVDLFLVIGSCISSNSKKLLHVAQRYCRTSQLIESEDCIDWNNIQDNMSIGITLSASSPHILLEKCLACIKKRFDIHIVHGAHQEDEGVSFKRIPM